MDRGRREGRISWKVFDDMEVLNVRLNFSIKTLRIPFKRLARLKLTVISPQNNMMYSSNSSDRPGELMRIPKHRKGSGKPLTYSSAPENE
jgi:hypothetical protein